MRVTGRSRRQVSQREWLTTRIQREHYFFHQIELPDGSVTPGWSNPKTEKLPFFRLPDDLTGMRVLDIGCAEGFFSFEAERRGAHEVVAIDSFPDSVRRFNICRDAFDSHAQAFLTNVYDISKRTMGTFDLVLFFGVLYHLRHPLLALEKISEVCSGTILLQTASFEEDALGDSSAAKFHPFGIQSGPPEAPIFDPTVFWIPNGACVRDMLAHVGFVDIQGGQTPAGAVFQAAAAVRASGEGPDQAKAPWS